jgi:hypothetical protein
VEDLSGLFVAERIDPLPLLHCQEAERRLGQLGCERECLIARQETVPAKDSHEPRQAGGGERHGGEDRRVEAQRGEVDQARDGGPGALGQR